MTTYTGTAHFVSRAAAISYYAEYGNDVAEIDRKLAEGEIHIGKPSTKPGERLSLIDEGRRYAIHDPA